MGPSDWIEDGDKLYLAACYGSPWDRSDEPTPSSVPVPVGTKQPAGRTVDSGHRTASEPPSDRALKGAR